MHGVAFRVWFLALRIIAKIELERRLSFPKIGAKPRRPPQRFASQEKNGGPPNEENPDNVKLVPFAPTVRTGCLTATLPPHAAVAFRFE